MSLLKTMNKEFAATTLTPKQSADAVSIVLDAIGGKKGCSKIYTEKRSGSKTIKFYGIEKNAGYKRATKQLTAASIPFKTTSAFGTYNPVSKTNPDTISISVPADFDHKSALNGKSTTSSGAPKVSSSAIVMAVNYDKMAQSRNILEKLVNQLKADVKIVQREFNDAEDLEKVNVTQVQNVEDHLNILNEAVEVNTRLLKIMEKRIRSKK